jgi:hypothetical protein
MSRTRFLRIALVLVVGVAVIWAAVVVVRDWSRDPIPTTERAVLESAETMELFGLDPNIGKQTSAEDERTIGFHGYPVLRRTQVSDASTRAKVARAVIRGWRQFNDEPYKCFDPHHGIRVTRGDQTADFVICFSCKQAHAYSATDYAGYFLTGDAAQELLDKLLKDGIVPVDPKARP